MTFHLGAMRLARVCVPLVMLVTAACGSGEQDQATPPPAAGVEQLGLSVSVSGVGTVTSAPSGINCGADCSENYDEGAAIALTETPAAGYVFAGWSGAGASCGTNASCTVSMTVARSVTATFQPQQNPPSTPPAAQYQLTVVKSGSGTVTSAPAGIACGADCSESYAAGTSVVLSAAASAGSTFSGWSGTGISCAGTGTCSVTLSAATTITAAFAAVPPPSSTTATLQISVTGSGRVTSTPAGIDCPGDCTEDFPVGTTVTLNASAASGFLFSGWSGGGCTINSACAVIMSTSLAVSSAFGAQGGAGKTYYVSPSGSDSSTGLALSTPFKTIGKAVSVVSAGDIIEVRAGTYNENVVVRRPGAANSWITMRGYNGESPVVRGTSSGPTIYFYADACDESNIGSGTGNTDCQPMYWVIQNMVVRGSAAGGGDGNAIKIDTPKVRLANNKLCCAAADIVKLVRTSNDVEIRGNELWQDAAVTTPSSNAQAIDIVGADRTIVFGNYVHDVPDIGIYAKGNSRETVFDSNVLVNIGSNALMLGQSTDADRLADGVYETYDGIVRNNVVVNGDWACLASSSSQNARFLNNSCYNTGRVTHGSILLSNESEVGTAGTNIQFINNIFYGSANRPILKITSNGIADYKTLTFDNNIYYTSGGAPTFSSSDKFSTPISFAQWLTTYQTLSTHVDHSKVVDPLFSTTTGATPLTLSNGSPAIDAGQSTSLVPVDARNVSRPQGSAIDIGAYEY